MVFPEAETARKGLPLSQGVRIPREPGYWRPHEGMEPNLTREWSAEELQEAMALQGV